MRDLVVLHGAWHQPAHLDVVAESLRQRGATVTVPDLGGLPLASGTALVQEVVDAAAEPPVVLAHSFGGVTACGLERAAHLLLVAAFVADRAVALLRPEPASVFTEAAARSSYREIPSTYVACSEDRAILPEMVDRFAERCTERITWPTSHSPYLSRPGDVVDLALAHL